MGSGGLDVAEFEISRIDRKLVSKESRMKNLFVKIDQNDNGRLSCGELREVLHHVHPEKKGKFNEAHVSDVMSEVDEDHDGTVSYDEFMHMWDVEKARPSVYIPSGTSKAVFFGGARRTTVRLPSAVNL